MRLEGDDAAAGPSIRMSLPVPGRNRCAISRSLLDALVYTRSRNSKLKLIGDYLKADAGPRPRLCARRFDRRARHQGGKAGRDPGDRRGTGRPGFALYEPRLCRRHGRDRLPALAQAARRAGRAGRRRAPDLRVVERLQGLGRADAPAELGADARPSRRERPIRLAQAGDRRASPRRFGAARQDRARQCVRARRRCGRGGLARNRRRLICRLFAWAEGRGAQPSGRGRAGVPAVHARPSARGAEGLARRLCRRVEMGRDQGPARQGRRPDPALQPRRRRYQPKLPRGRRGVRPRRACWTANCWSRARSRAPTRMAARRPASTRSSKGWAERSSRPRR